ncbi:helix-turn-helix domain-containing protein [Hymenobacter norwichensis]|uniref:helix-turn-helix domain-containing protein n=1 Tax=Hymenobacter norwichensis TaxID=223903 RepID=UPI0003B66553|nr:AraC family transcriptional regulator [Hymenobacter norwichensis]
MTFTFNAYSSLLLPFFLQGIVVSVVLLTRGRRHGSTADGWLALLLLLHTARLAQWMLGFAGWYDAHNVLSTFMFYFPFSNWLALGPALYFYFRSLTNQEFQFRRHHFRHFVPVLLYLGWRLMTLVVDLGWLRGVQGVPLPYHFGTKGPLAAMQEGVSFWVEIAGYVSVGWYAWLTLREYRQYRRYINDYFSDTEQIRFVWLRNLLVAMLLGVSVTFLFSVVNVSVQPLSYYQAWYEFLATGILIYFLGIAGLLTNDRLAVPLQFLPAPATTGPLVVDIPQVPEPRPETPGTQPVAEAMPSMPTPVTTANTDAADPHLARWLTRLTEIMTTDRPYLAPELTLSQLATQVGTNTSVLSRVINTGFGQNFNDYVNEYRVREAERLLRDPRHQQYTLLAVALESGFNSKSTFNRVFKKLRGATPSEIATGLKP